MYSAFSAVAMYFHSWHCMHGHVVSFSPVSSQEDECLYDISLSVCCAWLLGCVQLCDPVTCWAS